MGARCGWVRSPPPELGELRLQFLVQSHVPGDQPRMVWLVAVGIIGWRGVAVPGGGAPGEIVAAECPPCYLRRQHGRLARPIDGPASFDQARRKPAAPDASHPRRRALDRGGQRVRSRHAGEGDDGHTHETKCLNCGAELTGEFCHACGQHAHVHRTLTAFFHDFLHGVLHFEGKIWRTLPLLMPINRALATAARETASLMASLRNEEQITLILEGEVQLTAGGSTASFLLSQAPRGGLAQDDPGRGGGFGFGGPGQSYDCMPDV